MTDLLDTARKEQIRSIVCNLIELDEAEVRDTDLFVEGLGADSMKLIEIMANLEIEFDLDIDEDEVDRIVNIEGVFAVMYDALKNR